MIILIIIIAHFVGISDKMIAQFILGLAKKAVSPADYIQKLKDTDALEINDKIVKFSEELFAKVGKFHTVPVESIDALAHCNSYNRSSIRKIHLVSFHKIVHQPLLRSCHCWKKFNLKWLWHGQKWLHLFVDSAAYMNKWAQYPVQMKAWI